MMHIGEVSKHLQLSRKTIRLYEEKGLIQPQKANNGYRIYSEEEIQCLTKIKLLRTLDFSLQDSKDIIQQQQFSLFDIKRLQLEERKQHDQTILDYLDAVKESFMDPASLSKIDTEYVALLATMPSQTQERSIDFDAILVKILLSTLLFLFPNFDTLMGMVVLSIIVLCYSLHKIVAIRCFVYNIISLWTSKKEHSIQRLGRKQR